MEFLFPLRSHSLFKSNYKFKEALLLEMTGNNKKIKVYVIYRSLSQNNSEFDSLLLHIEQRFRGISKCKSTAPGITGDFNKRSLSWWSGDQYLEQKERSKIIFKLKRVFAINF